MKKLSLLIIALTVPMCSLYSQNKTIKGRVISEYFDILTGTSIMIHDTVEVGRVDSNGFFQIDIPIFEKKLFRSLGLESVTLIF
ncbi:MAG: hypothetical protein U5K79_17680 [Cyclobacteriaceae bacterium]|nr:hypothetical protein [Cyclobacteriaceae bacterium]